MKKLLALSLLVFILFSASAYFFLKLNYFHEATFAPVDFEELEPAEEKVASSADLLKVPGRSQFLPGNVLIADRGNNRLIEVTPDKKIVWEFSFNSIYPNLAKGYGADDAFFAPDGKSIITNLEDYQVLLEIGYPDKSLVWNYGRPGRRGHAAGLLSNPDDAYRLAEGLTSVADIKNCRILFLNRQKEIVRQFGQTGLCDSKPGHLAAPNGDTPLRNGDTLVTTIWDHSVIEINPKGQEVFRLRLPINYPSDAQLTKDGNILVADYEKNAKVIEIDKTGKIVWEFYFPGDPEKRLSFPSLAIELPSKNILLNDDGRHRVILIDKKSKEIVWQYGVTDKPGAGPGQLNTPDGLDVHSPKK